MIKLWKFIQNKHTEPEVKLIFLPLREYSLYEFYILAKLNTMRLSSLPRGPHVFKHFETFWQTYRPLQLEI